MSSLPDLRWKPFWMDLAKKTQNKRFFSKIKPKILQNYPPKFSKQCLSRLIYSHEKLLDCPIMSLVSQTGACYTVIVKNCIIVWTVFIDRLDSFENNLPDIFHHGPNQQICICGTSFNDNVPANSPRIANFTDKESKNVETVWFFQRNKADSEKPVAAFTSARYQSTFFEKIVKTRDCHWLRLVPRNECLIGGKCP